MRIRMMMAMLLAAAVTAAGLAGCSAGSDGEKDKDKTKGRYVEKQMEFPAKEGENIVGFTEGNDKEILIFTNSQTEKKNKVYRYNGSQFTEEDASWLNADSNKGTLSNVSKGDDGNLYALYVDDTAKSQLIKYNGEGASQEISIPENAETVTESGMEMYPYVSDIHVDKDGNIFLAYPITGEVVMYDQETGDKIRSFSGNPFNGLLKMPMDVKEDRILLISQDGSGFTCYDTNTGEVTDEIKYTDMNAGVLKLGDNNDCVYADSKGLHHMTLGGSVSEDLMGGNASSLGTPQSDILSLLELQKEEYTVLLQTQNASGASTYQILQYVYDESAKATPDSILTIYGLRESRAVRQAIAKFQQEHADVGIEYKTGNAGEGTGTKADSIRALNTELLGGSGADIIMLDGLPADSYIEKGVLADLDDVLKEVKKESAILDNIIDPYKKDGHIYQLPTRYGIPLFTGSIEKADVLKSADSLISYMDSHEWEDLMEPADKNELMGLLLNIYYKEIVDDDQKINTELLANLMETAGKMEESEEKTGIFAYGSAEEEEVSAWDVGRMGNPEDEIISSQEIKGVQGMMMPFHYLRKTQEKPSDVNGIFTPHDIAGINKSSENVELAEEFVKMLLSDEIQSVDVEGGFPVNEQAVDALVQSVEENPDENGAAVSIASSSSSADEEGNEEISNEEVITLPHRSEVQLIAEMGKSLTVPVQIDDIIGEMILDGAKTYFDGSRSAKEAAADIAEKADTYLAE